VQFFFGDTVIRAKVKYPQNGGKQEVIKDVPLKFYDRSHTNIHVVN